MKLFAISLLFFSTLAQAEIIYFSGGVSTSFCDYEHCHGSTSSWVNIEIEVPDESSGSGDYWFPRESYRGMHFDRGISVSDWNSEKCLVTFFTNLHVGQNIEKRSMDIPCEELYKTKRIQLQEPYSIDEYKISSSIYIETQ